MGSAPVCCVVQDEREREICKAGRKDKLPSVLFNFHGKSTSSPCACSVHREMFHKVGEHIHAYLRPPVIHAVGIRALLRSKDILHCLCSPPRSRLLSAIFEARRVAL